VVNSRSKLNILFDKLQKGYSKWEFSVWGRLGGFGVWMKKRRSRKIPDWRRVQNVWIWISILALITGYNVAGFYFQYQCNKHIVEEFYPEIACANGFKCNLSDSYFSGLNLTMSNISELPLLHRDSSVK